MNKVEETLRAIDNTIGYHRKQINELTLVKKELMDKYNIIYGDKDEKI